MAADGQPLLAPTVQTTPTSSRPDRATPPATGHGWGSEQPASGPIDRALVRFSGWAWPRSADACSGRRRPTREPMTARAGRARSREPTATEDRMDTCAPASVVNDGVRPRRGGKARVLRSSSEGGRKCLTPRCPTFSSRRGRRRLLRDLAHHAAGIAGDEQRAEQAPPLLRLRLARGIERLAEIARPRPARHQLRIHRIAELAVQHLSPFGLHWASSRVSETFDAPVSNVSQGFGPAGKTLYGRGRHPAFFHLTFSVRFCS